MKKNIPLSTPKLSLDIVKNLRECIETGWVSTGGRFIGEFENKIAKYVGVDEAVSMQSGTAGIHIALKVLGIGPDDEVIVPTLTFIAAVNPVTYVGASPVFMDCDDSLCMDPDKLEQFCEEECILQVTGNSSIDNGELKIDNECENFDESKISSDNLKSSTVRSGTFLTENDRPAEVCPHDPDNLKSLNLNHKPNVVLVNKSTGKRISAIIVVHVFGNLTDMEKIMAIAEKYNLKVIEDATEALGSYYIEGKYKGKHAGTIGDIGIYSFNANKIITTGGGGMIVSNNKEYLKKARYLGVQAKNDSLYFVHDEIGYNYRMLNIQAALGVDQIDRLEGFIETKIKNYNLYKKLLTGNSGFLCHCKEQSDAAIANHKTDDKSINNLKSSTLNLKCKGINLLPFKEDIRANHWFYSILIDEEKYGMSRDELLIKLNKAGIQSRPLWRLIHKQKPYEDCQTYKIEKALYYEEKILNVPCSTNLTEEEVVYVCDKLKRLEVRG